jgi:hypothetical protein
MADDATVDIGADLKPLDKSLDVALGAFRSFGNKAKGIFNTILVGSGLASIFSGFSSQFAKAFQDTNRREQEISKLNTALKATGGISGYAGSELVKMADQMQELTGIEAETAMGAQAVLLQFQNLRGDVFKDILTAAADFSAQTGMELPAAAEKLGRALNDPLKGFQQLAKEGVVFSAEQKKLAEEMIRVGDVAGVQRVMLDGLASTFGGSAEAKAKTFSGQMMILSNTVEDVFEAIASALTPALTNLIPYLQMAGEYVVWAVEQWASWGDTLVDFGSLLVDYVLKALNGFVDAVAVGFAVVQTVIENWDVVVKGIFISFEYNIVKAFNTLVYFFDSVLPPLFDWFGKNWHKLLSDAYSFLGTVLYNMGVNVSSFFEQVWSWLQGGEFNWEWKGLLEGFESTIDKLPQIAERIPGETEKMLGEQSAALGKKFSDNLSKNIKTNKDFAKDMLQSVGLDIDKKKNGGTTFTPSNAPYEVNKDPSEQKDKTAGKFEDLASLNKRISAAAFKTPESKELETQTGLMKSQNDAFGKFAKDSQDQGKKVEDELKELNKNNKSEVLPGFVE